MPESATRPIFTAVLLLAAAACGGDAEQAPLPPLPEGGLTFEGSATPQHSPRSLALYDETKVIELRVDFPPGEWERLLTLRGEASLRWVRCSFSFEGETVPEAACRRKGNMFDWNQAKKPSFLVRFNLTDPQGRFRGVRRLNLEYFQGTDAPIRDRLAMWLMRNAGIDAPRVNHARVFRDGQYLGAYQNIEVLDKEFLEDHFGAEADGNLWDGGSQLETNEAVNDKTRLRALQKLVEDEPMEGDHTAFWAALATMMDVRQVLREMAAETALISNDNFSNGSFKNFYYYEHPRRGFLVLPWDLDTILTASPADSDPFAHWATYPPSKLRMLMNANPAWRAQFVDDLVQIRDVLLARLPAAAEAVCAQVRQAVAEDMNRVTTVDAFDVDCQNVRLRAGQRIAALKRLLGR